MAQTTIDRPIINLPYKEPSRHWRYERETRAFSLADCRLLAGCVNWPGVAAGVGGVVGPL